jgi:hypothetical protein
MLPRRIKLAHARQSQVFATPDFVQSHLAGPRIDGAKRQKHIGMFFDCAGNVVVGHRREAGNRFVSCIHDDGHHLARAVLVRHLVDGDRWSLTAKVFRHLGRAGTFGFLSEFIG